MREAGLVFIFLSSVSAHGVLHLDEGAKCKEGNPPWLCVIHSNCPTIKEVFGKKQFPKICSFKGRSSPIVCCRPSHSKSHPGKSGKYPDWEELSSWASFYQPPSQDSFIWAEIISSSSQNHLQPTTTHQMPSTNRQSKAKTMCLKYGKHVWRRVASLSVFQEDEEKAFCGRVVETLIVDGEPAAPMEFPHMARIGYGEKNTIEWLCGGSLISERFILSAAHCTNLGNNRIANWANLGDLDTSTNEDDAQPLTIRIIERINHPEYTPFQKYHDIALYKLETEAPLGIYIRPICLNTEKMIRQPTALATGWGHTSWGGRESSKLQKVKLNIVSNKICNSTYKNNIGEGMELPEGVLPDYMICAGGLGEKDTCQGDSGGPLQVALDTPYCMYSLIGITAFGKRCGYGFPGVYTNVAHYVKWIEDTVWP